MKCLAALCLAACAPTIPLRSVDPLPPAAAEVPQLAPCVLLHGSYEDSLSNGARGWFRGPWQVAYSTFVLKHPSGIVLIDAAVGDTVNADLDAAPFYFRWSFSGIRPAKPLAVLLHEAGIAPEQVTRVLLTHPHWDHTGGLAQVPSARVVMDIADAWVLDAEGSLEAGVIPAHFKGLRPRLELFTPDGPPMLGFPASHDVFGDGSIIALASHGHTPGATSYLVNGAGKRWLFVGDAAWVKENFTEPVLRGRMASSFVDADEDGVAEVLGTLHAIDAAGAAVVVTSHDERTWGDMPRCVP